MFTKTVRFAVSSLVKNAGLLQRPFPHATLIVSKCGANYIITLLSMLVLIPFMILYDLSVTWRLICLRCTDCSYHCLSSSNRILLAPAGVRYRDIDHLVGFVTRVGSSSQVMYTIAYIPKEYQRWYYLIIQWP